MAAAVRRQQRKLYIDDLISLSDLKQDRAALNESLQVAVQAVEAARRWTRSAPAEPKARNALMKALWRQGAVLEAGGKHPDAKKVLEEALAIADTLHGERPKDAIAAFDAADARKFLATTMRQLGEYAAGLARVREGEAILDGLIAGAPENREWRYSRILLTSLRSVLLMGWRTTIRGSRSRLSPPREKPPRWPRLPRLRIHATWWCWTRRP